MTARHTYQGVAGFAQTKKKGTIALSVVRSIARRMNSTSKSFISFSVKCF